LPVPHWTYESLGRIVEEQLDSHDDSLDYTATYVFDLVGNRLSNETDQGSDSTIDETIIRLIRTYPVSTKTDSHKKRKKARKDGRGLRLSDPQYTFLCASWCSLWQFSSFFRERPGSALLVRQCGRGAQHSSFCGLTSFDHHHSRMLTFDMKW
jgi:hypothetical protein